MGAMRVWGVTATEAWEPRGCGGNKQAYPTGEVQGGGSMGCSAARPDQTLCLMNASRPDPSASHCPSLKGAVNI